MLFDMEHNLSSPSRLGKTPEADMDAISEAREGAERAQEGGREKIDELTRKVEPVGATRSAAEGGQAHMSRLKRSRKAVGCVVADIMGVVRRFKKFSFNRESNV